MNNKYITKYILLILFVILFCACTKHKEEFQIPEEESTYVPKKEFKDFDFHNYPKVKEEPIIEKQEEIPQPRKIQQKQKFSLKTQKSYSHKTKTAVHKSIAENQIPAWVYNNTSSSDRYAKVIRSNQNTIFIFYSNPQKQQAAKAMIKRAKQHNDINNFVDKSSILPADGASITCNKAFNDLYCQHLSNGNDTRCKCIYHYLAEKCTDSFCLINPLSKTIVFVGFDEYALTSKLKELKDKW